VHLVTADDDEMCRRLVTALQNFLSLICSMSGPCRLPFVGLVAVAGPQPEASVLRNWLSIDKISKFLHLFQYLLYNISSQVGIFML